MADGTGFRSVAPSRAQNLEGLERYLARCLADGPHKDEPARFFRLNAEKAEGWLHLMSQEDRPLPEHLTGLSALEVSDVMDALNAAARRWGAKQKETA
jgi:hypothetical protein